MGYTSSGADEDGTVVDLQAGDDRATLPTSAHAAAVEALLGMRQHGSRLLALVMDVQTLAPHHLHALCAVAAGATSLQQIAATTDRHVSSVSRTVDQLVTEGLVAREDDPEDRRHVVLRPTLDGEDVVERFSALDEAVMHRLVGALDEEEAGWVTRLLGTMSATAERVLDELQDDPCALQGLVEAARSRRGDAHAPDA